MHTGEAAGLALPALLCHLLLCKSKALGQRVPGELPDPCPSAGTTLLHQGLKMPGGFVHLTWKMKSTLILSLVGVSVHTVKRRQTTQRISRLYDGQCLQVELYFKVSLKGTTGKVLGGKRSIQVIARRWRGWQNSHRLFRASLAVLQLLKRNFRGANHPTSSPILRHKEQFKELSSAERVLISLPVFPVGESDLTQDYQKRLFEQTRVAP